MNLALTRSPHALLLVATRAHCWAPGPGGGIESLDSLNFVRRVGLAVVGFRGFGPVDLDELAEGVPLLEGSALEEGEDLGDLYALGGGVLGRLGLEALEELLAVDGAVLVLVAYLEDGFGGLFDLLLELLGNLFGAASDDEVGCVAVKFRS